ncbi:hypothetical protein Dsin_022893 [Dipteronia sinensis]|uniref:RNase H type-1 domain-containing protein n=1 Tax=Dipteronia sinensis TaxID=43782 RepID=A0AAE0E084_9ROSI|nr:hypothetical protein Dsin_022893 [Dipteronia sinensis]
MCVDKHNAKVIRLCKWSHPLGNDLTFNVDGSARGGPSLDGIGGALIDANGKIMHLFWSCIGLTNSNTAEVYAIHRACKLISFNQFLAERHIIIISDSKAAVAWVNGEGLGLLNLVDAVYDTRQILLLMNSVSIIFKPWSSNSLADSLAKAGSGLKEERI